MALPPKVSLLDPRSREAFAKKPTANSVNIPLPELALRMGELGRPEELVMLAGADLEAAKGTKEFLERGGRRAVIVADIEFTAQPTLGRLWSPSEWLEQHLSKLQGSSALDLGCGTGRNAALLASLGYSVLAVDNLPSALEKTRSLVERYANASVETQLLEYPHGLSELKERRFDVVLSLMAYHEELPEALFELVNPGGVWLIEAYSREHGHNTGKPKDLALTLPTDTLEEALKPFSIKEFSVVKTPESERVCVFTQKG